MLSAIRNASIAGWHMATAVAKEANIPGALSMGADTVKHLTTDSAPQAAGQAVQWVSKNPGTTAAYGAAGLGLVAVAVPAVVASPALAAAGFGGNGIVGGSIAAGVQSGIGNVVAPSVFATLQSAGMAGYGVAVVNTAVQAGGAVVAAGSGAAAVLKSKL